MTVEREKTGETAGDAKASRGKRRAGMSLGFALFAATFVLGTVLQHLAGWSNAIPNLTARVACVWVGLSAFALTLGIGFGKDGRRFLTSVRFAVPAVFALTAVSVVGTLILQSQPEAAMDAAYGSALPAIRLLMLDDVFHSYGFAAMLGLGAASLTLTVLRKRKLNLRYAGVLGAHTGLLLVLAGAAIGNLNLIKGRLNLHVGQSADKIVVGQRGDELILHSLGFTLKLDKFELLHYDPEYRVSVVQMAGRDAKRLATVNPADEAKRALDSFGVKVLDYWPDHAAETVVTSLSKNAATKLPKIAALAFKEGLEKGDRIVWVFDEAAKAGGRLVMSRTSLVFFWDQERANGFLRGQRSQLASSPHEIEVAEQRLPVEVGGTYPLPGTDRQVRVIRALQDFVVDSASGKPQNRSNRPNNPALEVEITDSAGAPLQRTWLFARFAGFHGSGKDSPSSGMRYVFSPDAGKGKVSAIAVGETAELWLLERGEVASKMKLRPGQKLDIGGKQLTVEALHASVRYSVNHTTRSDKANNPVAWIGVQDQPRP